MEVEVRASDAIRHYVNVQKVFKYGDTQYDREDKSAQALIVGWDLALSEGYISLQAESRPIEFQNIEMIRLSEDNPL